MSSDDIGNLTARVELLERDVAIMRGILWRSAAPQPPQTAAPPAARPWVAPPPGQAWPPPAPTSLPKPRDEARLAGAWFARGGALAVLIGAGFAFKYGIDHGLITRADRVLIGLLAGLAFVAWGYWARRKGWMTFSQAVTAGGIAICYLSVTVADLGYHLISGPVAFAGLLAITAGSAALAYCYDSLALAILATVGGFLDPFLAWRGGPPQPAALYAYLGILDAGVLGLAFFKDWRWLDAVALAGTWLLFGIGLSSASFGVGEGFASVLLLLFIAVPFAANLAPSRRPARPSGAGDSVMLALSGAAYFAYSMFLLWDHDHASLQGVFTFGLAAAFAGLAWLAMIATPRDPVLRRSLSGMAVAATTVAIPLQFHHFAIALGWAVEGLALSWVGMRARRVLVRNTGTLILGGGALLMVGLLFDHYTPSHVLVSAESANVLGVIAALVADAFLLSRDTDPDSPRLWYPLCAVAANGLAVAWLSAEAVAHYHPAFSGGAGWQPLQFTLSATWAIYAGVLLGAGVATRQRWARLAALALFALTAAKMAVIDLWTLSTGERVLAFIGIGAVLLACSLLYHRFKDLIFAPEAPHSLAP